MAFLVPVAPVVGVIGLPTPHKRAPGRRLAPVAVPRVGRLKPATLNTGVGHTATLRIEVAERPGTRELEMEITG